MCVIWSNETRPDAVFTIGANAPLASQGWTKVVDKTKATSTTDLAGCTIALIAAEAWGVTGPSRTLALAWYNAGGKVISTGNNTGDSVSPLPELIASIGPPVALPYGGSIRSSAGADAITPKFPSWEPGPVDEVDPSGTGVTGIAPDATCVATVSTNAAWCAAITKQNNKGGRWVHLHTKIGSMSQPGDHPLADAALTWLIS